MLSAEQKQWIEETLREAELRLQAAQEEVALNPANRVPAKAQEAVRLLKVIDDRLPAIEAEDAAYSANLQQRVTEIWLNYVRATNLSGLGACADVALNYGHLSNHN